MKYFIILSIILFIGCDKKENNQQDIKSKPKIIEPIKKDETNIKIKDLTLTFKKNRLIYPNKKVILLFSDGKMYSKEEARILKKLNVKFYETKNRFLNNYFNIKYYPTIVVLDKNKTVKYENFTPYEILKAEGF